MGEILEKDTEGGGEQTGEVVESSAGGESESKSDDGWSLNDVPEAIRGEVERAIKPFHARATKAEQRAAEYDKRLKEYGDVNPAELRKQIDDLNKRNFLLATDDNFRNATREKFGIRSPEKKSELPEGWDSPDAKTARSLLWNEFKQQFQQETGVKFEDFQNLTNSANGMNKLVLKSAQDEISATQKAVQDKGLPWDEDILADCISIVARMHQKGEDISLQQAYDAYSSKFIQAKEKEIASTDVKLKTKKLPIKDGGKGGHEQLKGDAKLRAVIDDMGLPGSYQD